MTNRKPPMITIHSYAPLCFGGPVIFIVSLEEGGVVGSFFFFLGGGGSHGFQEEWREAQLSPKKFKRETMENWLSINSQWGECIRIWKSLMGESGKFLLWHNNKILHSSKTINNNHQPLYKLSYLLNSANSALLFPDSVKRCQIDFVRCIFCPVRVCDKGSNRPLSLMSHPPLPPPPRRELTAPKK